MVQFRCVVQVSGTHRLDDNKAERQRCEEAGYEVCKSTVDGKPVGPERVWPGGLAMSRTIGDHMVGKVSPLQHTTGTEVWCPVVFKTYKFCPLFAQ